MRREDKEFPRIDLNADARLTGPAEGADGESPLSPRSSAAESGRENLRRHALPQRRGALSELREWRAAVAIEGEARLNATLHRRHNYSQPHRHQRHGDEQCAEAEAPVVSLPFSYHARQGNQ